MVKLHYFGPIIQDANLSYLRRTSTLLFDWPITSAGYDNEGRRLAVAISGRFDVFDALTRELIGSNSSGSIGIEAIAFHPSGQFLVTCEPNAASLIIWEAGSWRRLRDVRPPTIELYDRPVDFGAHQPLRIAFTPSGQTMITCGLNGECVLWDWNNGNPDLRSVLRGGYTEPVRAMRMSNDGVLLATGESGGSFLLWRASFDRNYSAPVARHEVGRAVWDLDISQDGTLACFAGDAGFLRVVETGYGRHLADMTGPGPGFMRQYTAIAFTTDGSMIIAIQSSVAGGASELQFWSTRSFQLLRAEYIVAHTSCIVPSPNGRQLFMGLGSEGMIWHVDLSRPPILPPILYIPEPM